MRSNGFKEDIVKWKFNDDELYIVIYYTKKESCIKYENFVLICFLSFRKFVYCSIWFVSALYSVIIAGIWD